MLFWEFASNSATVNGIFFLIGVFVLIYTVVKTVQDNANSF